jgi:hypothetical protein
MAIHCRAVKNSLRGTGVKRCQAQVSNFLGGRVFVAIVALDIPGKGDG